MRYFLVLFFLFLSCSKTESLDNFSLLVKVDGLKKGTLYLEKFSDSSLFKIDSGYFNGNNSVEFKGKIEGPELMILSLTYENELDPKQLPFFIEKSEIIFNATKGLTLFINANELKQISGYDFPLRIVFEPAPPSISIQRYKPLFK